MELQSSSLRNRFSSAERPTNLSDLFLVWSERSYTTCTHIYTFYQLCVKVNQNQSDKLVWLKLQAAYFAMKRLRNFSHDICVWGGPGLESGPSRLKFHATSNISWYFVVDLLVTFYNVIWWHRPGIPCAQLCTKFLLIYVLLCTAACTCAWCMPQSFCLSAYA